MDEQTEKKESEEEIKKETDLEEPRESSNEESEEVEEKEDKKLEEEKEKPREENKVISKDKEGSFKPLIFVMLASLIIAFYWDKLPFISDSIHYILNPTAGSLISWNLNLGMLLIVIIITFITTLVQKYGTDQKTLKELKKESKEIQKQMKEFREHPEKLMELQKKQFALFPKQMKLSTRAILYTGIPFILFFRWFSDYFTAAGNPKFILGMGWFLFYFVATILVSSILRKYMDVV